MNCSEDDDLSVEQQVPDDELLRGLGIDSPDGRLQVSVYAVDRHFGGPEEGGWWYDALHFIGVSERVLPGDINTTKAHLLAKFADKQPQYPLGSVLSDGPEYHVYIEARAGEMETTTKPRYE